MRTLVSEKSDTAARCGAVLAAIVNKKGQLTDTGSCTPKIITVGTPGGSTCDLVVLVDKTGEKKLASTEWVGDAVSSANDSRLLMVDLDEVIAFDVADDSRRVQVVNAPNESAAHVLSVLCRVLTDHCANNGADKETREKVLQDAFGSYLSTEDTGDAVPIVMSVQDLPRGKQLTNLLHQLNPEMRSAVKDALRPFWKRMGLFVGAGFLITAGVGAAAYGVFGRNQDQAVGTAFGLNMVQAGGNTTGDVRMQENWINATENEKVHAMRNAANFSAPEPPRNAANLSAPEPPRNAANSSAAQAVTSSTEINTTKTADSDDFSTGPAHYSSPSKASADPKEELYFEQFDGQLCRGFAGTRKDCEDVGMMRCVTKSGKHQCNVFGGPFRRSYGEIKTVMEDGDRPPSMVHGSHELQCEHQCYNKSEVQRNLLMEVPGLSMEPKPTNRRFYKWERLFRLEDRVRKPDCSGNCYGKGCGKEALEARTKGCTCNVTEMVCKMRWEQKTRAAYHIKFDSPPAEVSAEMHDRFRYWMKTHYEWEHGIDGTFIRCLYLCDDYPRKPKGKYSSVATPNE